MRHELESGLDGSIGLIEAPDRLRSPFPYVLLSGDISWASRLVQLQEAAGLSVPSVAVQLIGDLRMRIG